MNNREFVRQLAMATPDIPEGFHHRVETTLESIISQEKELKATIRQPLRGAGRPRARILAIAIALTMALAAAALAAARWHLFEQLPFLTGQGSPKNADAVMQGDLHRETVNRVEITIREAGYDGRTLLIQYSYRMADLDRLFSQDGVSEEDERLLADCNVGWWIDHIWLNGQCMDMPEGSGAVMRGSDIPGELVVTEYWRLDNEGLMLNGPVQISLPIGERQNLADYTKADHPEKYDADGNLKLPERGMVSFMYDAKNILAQVKTFHPGEEKELPEVTAKVREAAFSPLMTYITLDLNVNPEAMAAYISQNGEGFKDDGGNLLWPYGGADVFGQWVMSLELVDGQGRLLFPEHRGQNGYGNEQAEFLYPYLENIPDALYLAPIDENRAADMSRAVLVKAGGR